MTVHASRLLPCLKLVFLSQLIFSAQIQLTPIQNVFASIFARRNFSIQKTINIKRVKFYNLCLSTTNVLAVILIINYCVCQAMKFFSKYRLQYNYYYCLSFNYKSPFNVMVSLIFYHCTYISSNIIGVFSLVMLSDPRIRISIGSFVS